MRKMIGLLFLTLAVQPMLAKDNWPLTVKVLSTKNIEDPHGSFHLSWFGMSDTRTAYSSGGAGWSHRIHEDAFIEADNGNSYDLTPKNPKDMLLPGTYKAKIEKRDVEICEPKDNGKCREVKFWVVAAVPTVAVKGTELPQKTPEPVPTPAAVAPSPYLLSSRAVVGFVAVEDVLTPYALSSMDVVESAEVVELLLELESVSRSSTHCTVCVAALSALVMACDGVVFRSLCTVAKADWAVDRSPELMAVPSAVISVDNCDGVPVLDEELEDELLPLAVAGV